MQQQNTIIALESHMDELNARCVNLSKQITGVMTDTLLLHGVDFSQLNDNEAVITELEEKVYHCRLPIAAAHFSFWMLPAIHRLLVPDPAWECVFDIRILAE